MTSSHSGTAPGTGRSSDPDVVFADDRLGAYVVATGSGEAARTAAAAAIAFLRRAAGKPFTGDLDRHLDRLVRLAVEDANTAVYRLSRSYPKLAQARATITVLLISDASMAVGHVGGCRVTCFDRGLSYSLTHAHTVANELLRRGILSPAEAASHTTRHTLTRTLGQQMFVDVDVRSGKAAPGSTFVVAGEGLNPAMESAAFSDLAEDAVLADAPQRLIDLARQAGSEGNLSVIVVRCGTNAQTSERDAQAPDRNIAGIRASLEHAAKFFSRRVAPV